MKNIMVLSLILILSLAAQAQFCQQPKQAISTPNHVAQTAVDGSISDQQQGYASLDAAAIAALQSAAVIGKNDKGVEFGGCIFWNKSNENPLYYYTTPASNRSTDSIRIICHSSPQAPHFIGLYHTHPVDERIDGFSAHDIDVAEHLNVTSYVGSINSGNILKFQSCKTPKSCLKEGGGLCRKRDFSRGERVGRL